MKKWKNKKEPTRPRWFFLLFSFGVGCGVFADIEGSLIGFHIKAYPVDMIIGGELFGVVRNDGWLKFAVVGKDVIVHNKENGILKYRHIRMSVPGVHNIAGTVIVSVNEEVYLGLGLFEAIGVPLVVYGIGIVECNAGPFCAGILIMAGG